MVSELEPMLDTVYVTSLHLRHPGFELPFDPDMYHTLLVEAGFLPLGFCADGDIVVVDCRDPGLAVLYICHEEFDYEDAARASLTGIARQIDPSIRGFLARAEDGQVPADYFD